MHEAAATHAARTPAAIIPAIPLSPVELLLTEAAGAVVVPVDCGEPFPPGVCVGDAVVPAC